MMLAVVSFRVNAVQNTDETVSTARRINTDGTIED